MTSGHKIVDPTRTAWLCAAVLIVTVKGISTTAVSPMRTYPLTTRNPACGKSFTFLVRVDCQASQSDGTGYSSGMSLYLT